MPNPPQLQRPTRRQFLRSAAATAAAVGFPTIIPGTALGLGGSVSPSNRITMGFIGMGKMAQGHHGSFLRDKGVHILGICDVERNRREIFSNRTNKEYGRRFDKENYDACKDYNDFRDICARTDIDAMLIATPNQWHALAAVEAARNGKDIYLEKPLARTIGEGKAIVKAVRTYGRILQVGSQQRSDSAFHHACELVRNGRIGKVQHVFVNVGGPPIDEEPPPEETPEGLDWDLWLGPCPYRPYSAELAPPMSFGGWPNWRSYRDYAGGGMTDFGAHHYDIAQWGLGTDGHGPVSVTPPGDGVERLTYRYANGIEMYHGGAANGAAVEWVGTEGKVRVNRGQFLETDPAELKKRSHRPERNAALSLAQPQRQLAGVYPHAPRTDLHGRDWAQHGEHLPHGQHRVLAEASASMGPDEGGIRGRCGSEPPSDASDAQPVATRLDPTRPGDYPMNSILRFACGFSAAFALLAFAATAQDEINSLEDAFNALAGYKIGDDQTAVDLLRDATLEVQGSTSERNALANRYADVLEGNATFDAKQFACKQLFIIGTSRQVDTLAGLLRNPQLADAARYALEAIPGDAAGDALVDALENADRKVKVGIINSLGARASESTLDALTPIVRSNDAAMAAAAAQAVGAIGSIEAARQLQIALDSSRPEAHADIMAAMLDCATRLEKRGERDAAAELYIKLSDTANPDHIQIAALHGKVRTRGANAIDDVRKALLSREPAFERAGIALTRDLPGADGTAALLEAGTNATPELTAAILYALADRGDRSAAGFVIQALDSANEDVRWAALNTVPVLGGPEAVTLLAQRAAAWSGAEQRGAREALVALQGDGVDQTIAGLLGNADAGLQVEALRALAGRNAKGAMDRVIAKAETGGDEVRAEAYRALGDVAQPDDLPKIVTLLASADNDDDRNRAARAYVTASRRTAGETSAVSPVLDIFKRNNDPGVRAALASLLGALGDPEGLPMLTSLVRGQDVALKLAALDALAHWPDATPLDIVTDAVSIDRRSRDAGRGDLRAGRSAS